MPGHAHRPRAHARTLVFLALFLLIGAFFAVRDLRHPSSDAPLFRFGDVSRLELRMGGHSIELRRTDGTRWEVASFDDRSVSDGRANEPLIRHVLDLLRSLRDERREKMPAQEAPQYGMGTPALSVSLAWNTPEPGEDVVLFGNRDLSGSLAFVFSPKRLLLTLAPASLLQLLEGKAAVDLRDRTMSTFAADDVYGLATEGACLKLRLARDGDRWEWRSPPPTIEASAQPSAPEKTDRWLEELLTQKYDSIQEDDAPAPKAPAVCTLRLRGLYGKIETIAFRRSSRGDPPTSRFWAWNSALPAAYEPPARMLEMLGLR